MKGFTLIEIMVVLAVVAILAMLAIPNKTGSIVRTYIKQNMNMVEDYQSLAIRHYKIHNAFPTNNEQLGIPKPEKIVGKYLKSVTLHDGAFHLTMGNNINKLVEGKILSLRPIYVEDSPLSPVSWVCGYETIPMGMKVAGHNLTNIENQYLPLECREIKTQ